MSLDELIEGLNRLNRHYPSPILVEAVAVVTRHRDVMGLIEEEGRRRLQEVREQQETLLPHGWTKIPPESR